MTPEELDEARAEEAYRQWQEEGGQWTDSTAVSAIAARLAREGWTPPEPVVDPDLLAFREWWRTGEGAGDPWMTYLAGARMAREQERERAKPLVEYVTGDALRHASRRRSVARQILAKYQGEA